MKRIVVRNQIPDGKEAKDDLFYSHNGCASSSAGRFILFRIAIVRCHPKKAFWMAVNVKGQKAVSLARQRTRSRNF
jgi:hypothetical protein